MTIKMCENYPLGVLQNKLSESLTLDEVVVLDFTDMVNIEETLLSELFSSYPKSRKSLSNIKVVNASKTIIKSLTLVINSRKRG